MSLSRHINGLKKLQYGLISQITIMVPHNANESIDYTRYIDKLPQDINGVPLVVRRRHNVGLSYGSFSDCYNEFRDKTPFYMFMEDDYEFRIDHFDKALMDIMGNEEHRVGYVCGRAYTIPGVYPWHAGMSCGLIRSRALLDVWNHNGRLPHADNCDYNDNQMKGQVGLSQAMIMWGWGVIDVGSRYHVGFRHVDDSLALYGSGKEAILWPTT
jgi:hypothetical protein